MPGEPIGTAEPTGNVPPPPAPAASPPPPSPQRPATRVRKRRRFGAVGFVTDKAIPLLIAFLGLLAGLATTWGAIVTADVNDLQDKRDSLEQEVAGLTEENATLDEEVATVTEENDELREAAEEEASASEEASSSDDSDAEGSTTGVTTPAPERASAVLRETGGSPVTFSSGYAIDVDSPAPDWGVRSGSGSGTDLYFYCCGGSRPHLSTSEVSLVDHVPTEAECDDATVLQAQLATDQTRVGTQFCMRTRDGRLLYVHIAAIDEEIRTITLDLIVWK